jgi:hypothetical protein
MARLQWRACPDFSSAKTAREDERVLVGEIGGAAGESVTGGAGERGLVAVCDDRLGESAVEALKQRDGYGDRRANGGGLLPHHARGIFIAQHEGVVSWRAHKQILEAVS